VDGVGEGGQGVGAGGGVAGEALDVEEASVGLLADLPQGGQVTQPAFEVEVAGVVDGGLGAQRPAELVVLLDLGVFVADVQARGDPGGDDPGTEVVAAVSVDLPAQGQTCPAGAADV